jgi:alpha/beta superfamily hydrolase
MKQTFTFLAFLAFSLGLQAQNPFCDGTRYVDNVFSGVTVTSNVKYGENTTVAGVFTELKMDIYEPTGDQATARPVVFVGFGGSFIGGARTDASVVNFCNRFAKKGYVAVAFDYRLYDAPIFPFPDSLDMAGVVARAVGDIRAAVRYMREDAATTNTFRVDSNYIFVSGISAGSILALHAAYMDDLSEVPTFLSDSVQANGGLEGNSSSNYQYSSKVQGVLNMSGALYRTNMMDANDPPHVGIHETGDGTVPYAMGSAMVSILPIITVQGTSLVHARAQSLGIYSRFMSVQANAHVGYLSGSSSTMWYDSIAVSGARMFEGVACGSIVASFDEFLDQNRMNFETYPNPAATDMMVRIDGLDGRSYDVVISDNLGRTVKVMGNQSAEQFMLNRQDFGAGMYFLSIRFREGNQAPVTQKFIFVD